MGVLFSALRQSDRAAGFTADHLTTLGQLALAGLGTHLAADRLDDHLLGWATPARDALADAAVPALLAIAEGLGLSPGALVGWADWTLAPASASLALALELCTLFILAGALLLTRRDGRPTLRRWWAARCVHAVVLPATLAGVMLAGTWSLAMAAEDLLPPSSLAPWAAGALATAVLLRFGVPAWVRTVAALDPAVSWRVGLRRALVLAPIGLLVWTEALPLHALQPWLAGAL